MSFTAPSTGSLDAEMSLLTFEESSSKLWNQWLKAWFNGSAKVFRTVGGSNQSVTFPSASVVFQQQAISQPLDGLNIGVVLLTQPRVMHRRMTRLGAKWTQFRCSWQFYIRAKVNSTTGAGENSESLARKGSDLLFALLTIEENHEPLRVKGMTNIRAEPARLIVSPEYSMRAIAVNATISLQSGYAAVA